MWDINPMSKVARQLKVLGDFHVDSLIKVAFASSDGQTVDEHFGSARSLFIYGVGIDNYFLLDVIEFTPINESASEDKLGTKLDLIKDCIAVYSRACGASAIKKLLEKKIQPIKVSEGSQIKELIHALKNEIKDGPSSWLARSLQHDKQNNRL